MAQQNPSQFFEASLEPPSSDDAQLDWRRAHDELTRLAKTRARLDWHADGTWFGGITNPRMADAHTQAFRALCALGFREGETRRALERVRNGSEVSQVSTEAVLRAALGALSA